MQITKRLKSLTWIVIQRFFFPFPFLLMKDKFIFSHLKNCFSFLIMCFTERSPLKPTTLPYSTRSVSTGRSTTDEEPNVPTTSTTRQPSTADVHMTTNVSNRPTGTPLYRKRTTAGSVVSLGTESKGKSHRDVIEDEGYIPPPPAPAN